MSTRGDILQSLVNIVRTNLQSQNGPYKAGVVTVLDHDINTLTTEGTLTPMVMVIDSGRERPVVEDGSRFRFELDVQLRGYVKCSTGEQAISKIYEVMTDLLTLIYSAPSIHADVLEWRHISSEGVRHDWKSGAADILITTRLTYTLDKEESGVSGSRTGYSELLVEIALQKLIARLEALAAGGSSYSPTFSVVYDQHNLAQLVVPSASVSLSSADIVPGAAGGSKTCRTWLMTFSVRVHLSYAQGYAGGRDVAALLNSIANKLFAKFDLGDGYRLQDVNAVRPLSLISESQTVGGEMMVLVIATKDYTQE